MKKRIKSLEFHVEQGDYFGTIATVLDLLRQGVAQKGLEKKILKNLTTDLLYLQDRFTIVKQEKTLYIDGKIWG